MCTTSVTTQVCVCNWEKTEGWCLQLPVHILPEMKCVFRCELPPGPPAHKDAAVLGVWVFLFFLNLYESGGRRGFHMSEGVQHKPKQWNMKRTVNAFKRLVWCIFVSLIDNSPDSIWIGAVNLTHTSQTDGNKLKLLILFDTCLICCTQSAKRKKKPQIDFDLDEIELFRETVSCLATGNVSISWLETIYLKYRSFMPLTVVFSCFWQLPYSKVMTFSVLTKLFYLFFTLVSLYIHKNLTVLI